MGTNYYLHRDVCDHCGRGDEPLHIGKSSGGWAFTLHVVPHRGICDWQDWEALFKTPKAVIRNEYGDKVGLNNLREIVFDRGVVLRHDIDGRFCIGHGDGTYDMVLGEFS